MAFDSTSRPPGDEFMGELREARESGRRSPDFFVVGHAKCGTTALYEMLRGHPQIYMPIKETQFLSRGPRQRPAQKQGFSRRPQTLEAYLSLFEAAGPEQRAGEASTEYLREPSTAGRLAELCPDARIIAAFREPVSFLRSLHLQLLQVNLEAEGDFRKALRLEEPRRQGRRVPRNCVWPQALQYSQHVRYVSQLREYHEHFGRDRVLVLIYDDFRADNRGVVRQVLRFLDVDDSIEIAPSSANPTVRVRSQRAGKLVGAVSVGRSPASRGGRRLVKAVTSERLRRGALRAVKRMAVDTEPRPPDEEFLSELRQRFKPEVVATSEYLQRDLVSLWGYEDVQPAGGLLAGV